MSACSSKLAVQSRFTDLAAVVCLDRGLHTVVFARATYHFAHPASDRCASLLADAASHSLLAETCKTLQTICSRRPTVSHSAYWTSRLSLCVNLSFALQGGVIEVGAPTGKWQLIVVYRGKHCPVSRNYLASLQQIIYELDDLGVEVLALTADGREKAEAFVSFHFVAIQ